MVSVFWFRRDLRLHDNAGLFHALKSPYPVLPLFIFDSDILDDLANKHDARVTFIHHTIGQLKAELEAMGSTLLVYYGKPEVVWAKVIQDWPVGAVYTNRDYEPYAVQRDNSVCNLLKINNIPFNTYKDHVVFEYKEVLKEDGNPYTVFTPYSRKWLAKLATAATAGTDENDLTSGIPHGLKPYPTHSYFTNFYNCPPAQFPALSDLGFEPSDLTFPPLTIAQRLVENYDKTRDFPALNGTSRLGIHFRFGTISIREKALRALNLNATFLNELIWRDFYSQILAHFPHVVGHPFRPAYDRIPWRHAPEDFEKWKTGKTGYPIVDAGMRELNATGYMHNRVRMITASFLTKHLLLDWRLGEAYFAEKLLDYDLASNSGGWQWAAGCGTDAAPYFRIFNPTEQAKKFDAQNIYIRKWVPEFGSPHYPPPMTEHTFARQRCLEVYKKALQEDI